MPWVGSTSAEERPRWLLAELSYRCPLRCPYCSNPLALGDATRELTTAEWHRVLDEARTLGAVQLGLSGGEPLVRPDLEAIVAHARRLGYYSNLITSGVGLLEARLARLVEAGLDHVQISFQADEEALSDKLAGAPGSFRRKLRAARLVKAAGLPLALNFVLHRHNLERVPQILALSEELGADFVELANVQFDGWALVNRDALLPDEAAVRRAEAQVAAFRAAHRGRMRVFFVVPDYFEGRPKSCGTGWASVMLVVAPDGTALPCHGAAKLPLSFPNVRDERLATIWRDSAAFNAFRGDGWMPEPCRSCPDKAKDFGGCRCQAFLITGDPAQADPVCSKSPHHEQVVRLVQQAPLGRVVPIVFRSDDESRLLHPQAAP